MFAVMTHIQGTPTFLADDDGNTLLLLSFPEAEGLAAKHRLCQRFGYKILDADDWTFTPTNGLALASDGDRQ